MKINYLAYLDPYRYSGGGEQINRKLIDEARARGHDVRITSKDGPSLHENPRLWFLSDVFNCPAEHNRGLYPLIDSVVRGSTPYVHHDNAYVDLCWYGALPCNGRGMDGMTCHMKGAGCSVGRATPIYHKAALCSFLSPLHRDVHIGALGQKVLPLGKTILVPPAVDTHVFKNLGGDRDIAYTVILNAAGEPLTHFLKDPAISRAVPPQRFGAVLKQVRTSPDLWHVSREIEHNGSVLGTVEVGLAQDRISQRLHDRGAGGF